MLATNPDVRTRIQSNLATIRRRIGDACSRAGRPTEDVTLVAVTKSVGIAECRVLRELDVTHLGENRVEDAEAKIAALESDVRWHMIGSIQRRKARRVVEHFSRVDSVDRIELAKALNAHAASLEKSLPVLVQANVSGERSKHGFAPDGLEEALDLLRRMENLTVEGLMTMAPLDAQPEETRRVFRELARIASERELSVLSMGMTNDFEVAIEEGATEVRIGTALYQ